MARKTLLAMAGSLVLLLSLLTPLASAESCYYPNGTDANAGRPAEYYPCAPGSPVSMCCHIGDECRVDGLCLATHFDGNIWRDFCTDPTWKDPSCQKLCVNGTGVAYANNPSNRADPSVTVTPCSDGSYCCGNGTDALSCCSQGNGVFMVAGEAQKTNPSRAATESTKPLETMTNSTASQKADPSKAAVTSTKPRTEVTVTASAAVDRYKDLKDSNPVAFAGVIVGGVVALALVAGLGWFFWRRRKANQERSIQTPREHYGDGEAKTREKGTTELDGLARAELHQNKDRRRAELPQNEDGASNLRHEMGS